MTDPVEAPAEAGRFRIAPWLAVAGVALAAAFALAAMGQPVWCVCGKPFLWSGNVWSQHNSQHLADPYSFSHVLHGFLFFWLFTRLLPRAATAWRLACAVALEAGWELLENSPLVINRYREATAAVGYQGDTIVNSMSDILCCALGFAVARALGWRRTLALFVLIELGMLAFVRDNLTLNVLMLLCPIPGLKAWQMGG